MNRSHPRWEVSREFMKAYELYFEMLSQDALGLLISGRPWAAELYACDDGGNKKDTRAAMRHLVSAYRVRLFLASNHHELSLAAAEQARFNGAVLVSTSLDPRIYAVEARVFGSRLQRSGDTFAPALDALAARGARRLSFLRQGGVALPPECAALPELCRQRGLQISEGIGVTYATVGSAVWRLRAQRPDVVVTCTGAAICAKVLRTAREQKLSPGAFLFHECISEPELQRAPDSVAQYSLGVRPRVPMLEVTPALSPSRADFEQRWQWYHSTSEKPSYRGAAAFSSLASLLLAARIAGSAQPAAIAAAMANLTGEIESNGQRTIVPSVVQYNGFNPAVEARIVAPPTRSTHDLWYPRPKWEDWGCYNPQQANRQVGMKEVLLRRVCITCPAGKKSDFRPDLGWRVCSACPPGELLVERYRGDARELACSACAPGKMHVPEKGGPGACLFCPVGSFAELRGQTACGLCPAGRFSSAQGSAACTTCASFSGLGLDAFYSAALGSSTCHRCPRGALCEADAQGLYSSVTNGDGYYLLPGPAGGDPARAYACSHGRGRACLAHGRCHEDPLTGDAAMEGPMCGRCASGFGRHDMQHGLCERCASDEVSVVAVLLNLLLGACLIGAVILVTLSTDFARPRQLHSVILKQVMNYVQMAAIVCGQQSPLALEFPQFGAVLRSLSGVFELGGLGAASRQCLMRAAAPDLEAYQAEQVLGLTAVPLALLVLVLGFQVAGRAAASWGWQRPAPHRLVAAVIVVLFSLLSLVTERSLLAWDCHYYDELRLSVDPSVRCLAPENQSWQQAGGMGFLVFSLGIPAALYLLLRYYRRAGRFREPAVTQMLGFLTSGFEPHFYYFECVFMLRKVLFHFIVKIPNLVGLNLGDIQITQNTVLIILSGGFLSLHLYTQPYDNRCFYILDKIETSSLVAILATPLLQRLSFVTNDTVGFRQDSARELRDLVCYVVVLLLNGHFLLLVLWGLVRGPVLLLAGRAGGGCWPVRLLRLAVSDGEATSVPRGILLQGVSGSSEKLLCEIVHGVVELHLRQTGSLSFEGLSASLQRVLVEALHMRDQRRQQLENPVVFYLQQIRRRASRMPLGREAVEAAAAHVAGYLKSRGWRTSARASSRRHTHRASVEPGAARPRRSNVQANLTPFHSVNVQRTLGQPYSIEELHASLMHLSDDAFQLEVPVYESAGGEGRRDSVDDCVGRRQGMSRPSFAKDTWRLRHIVTAFHSDADSDDQLSWRQVLVSELRAARQETADIAAALERRRRSSQELRNSLGSAEAKLDGGPTDAAPQERGPPALRASGALRASVRPQRSPSDAAATEPLSAAAAALVEAAAPEKAPAVDALPTEPAGGAAEAPSAAGGAAAPPPQGNTCSAASASSSSFFTSSSSSWARRAKLSSGSSAAEEALQALIKERDDAAAATARAESALHALRSEVVAAKHQLAKGRRARFPQKRELQAKIAHLETENAALRSRIESIPRTGPPVEQLQGIVFCGLQGALSPKVVVPETRSNFLATCARKPVLPSR